MVLLLFTTIWIIISIYTGNKLAFVAVNQNGQNADFFIDLLNF